MHVILGYIMFIGVVDSWQIKLSQYHHYCGIENVEHIK